MFRKVGAQLGYNSKDWKFAETSNSIYLRSLLKQYKLESECLSVIGDSGFGKSEATKRWAEETPNVYRVECRSYWKDERLFLKEILTQLGNKNPPTSSDDMMDEILKEFQAMDNPQLIIDEVDKLKNEALYSLITFENELRYHLSIVIIATDYIKRVFDDGFRLRKKGFKELDSRFGDFIPLGQTTYADVKSFCVANGLEDESIIKIISKTCNGDLRKAKRRLLAYRISEKLELIGI